MAVQTELMRRFDPLLIPARWVVGGLSSEQLTSEALTTLAQGFEGIALQQLAGLIQPTLADLGDLPDRAFSDMGLKPIDREQAIEILLTHPLFTNDLMSSISRTFPGFSTRWRNHIEYWGGKTAGPYTDIAEFVHYVVEDVYQKGKLDEVQQVFRFFEHLLTECDQDTRDLVGLGFFETLQNVSSHQEGGYHDFEQFLGPVSLQIWQEIERIWEGKSSLADVIRAERNHA